MTAKEDIIEGALYSRDTTSNWKASEKRIVQAKHGRDRWIAIVVEDSPGEYKPGDIIEMWSHKFYTLIESTPVVPLCQCQWNKHPLFCKCK